MSRIRMTEQNPNNVGTPSTDNGIKTGTFFISDDAGELVPKIKDSDGNVNDFVGPQGATGSQGPIGPTGPPGTLAVQTVGDINNPTEIEALTLLGIGSDVIAHQVIGAGASDLVTNYLYDADGPVKNAPFVMNTGDGGTTRWIATGGRFFNSPITSLGIITAPNIVPATKEIFFSPGNDTASQDDYSVRTAGSTAQSFFSFRIPHDFSSLIALELLYFNSSLLVNVDIDLLSTYGQIGEDRNFNTESDTTTTYSSNANELSLIDASVVFSGITANDICGLHIDHNAIGATQKYIGLRLRYS